MKRDIATRIAALSAAGAALLGTLGLVGSVLRLPLLTAVHAPYRPIAPSAASALAILGPLLAWLALGGLRRRGRILAAVVSGLLAVYGLLEFIGFLVGADLNREDALTASLAKALSTSFIPMSPVAGALMFLVGAALFALLLRPAAGEAARRLGDAAGELGAAAVAAATVFVLSYAYGVPLLYHTTVTPIAITSALGFLLLGVAAVATAGPEQWPLRALVGPTVRARLLRTFLPLTVVVVFAISIARERVPALAALNRALESSLLAVVFATLAGLVAFRLAGTLGSVIDRAQAAQREAEGSLRASEQRWATTLASIGDAVIATNVDGRVAFINRVAEQLTGWAAPEAAGRPVTDVFHIVNESTRRQVESPVAKVLREGLVVGLANHTVLVKRNGTEAPIDDSGAPIRDQQGKTTGVVLVFHDITERKRAEQELQESRSALQRSHQELEQRVLERTAELARANEDLQTQVAERRKAEAAVAAERQRLFDVLETLPAMICLLTADYHVVFANRSFRERFGESHGRHCYDYCFGSAEPCAFCESYRVLTTGRPHQWEVTSPDGSVIEAYDFPFTDVDGTPMILEMDIDITARRRAETELARHRAHLEELVDERTAQLGTANAQLRAEIAERTQAEEALRESEERARARAEELQTVLDAVPAAVWISHDPESRVITGNAYADEVIMGIPRGGNISRSALPGDAVISYRVVHDGVELRAEELPAQLAAATGKAVYDQEVELRFGDGRSVDMVLSAAPLFDVEGRVRGSVTAGADVTALRRAERARAEMAERMVAEINHRMKNNFTLLSSVLGLQAMSLPQGSAGASALRDAVTRLTALSVVHEQLFEARSARVDLRAILQRIAQLDLQAVAPAVAASFQVSGDETSISSKLGSTLALVANELIGNALKHGAPGASGKLEIEVLVSRRADGLRLRVWNSGRPVPQEFDVSRQTGMGLSLVDGVVTAQLHGAFTLRAERGGTAAEVFIPESEIKAAEFVPVGRGLPTPNV